MQRDKRIGLALAILLIGFATAFCFRPENGGLLKSPQLNNPEAIDSQLAVQNNVPYLTGLEEEHESQKNKEKTNQINAEMVSSTQNTPQSETHWEPYSFLNEDQGKTTENIGEEQSYDKYIDKPPEDRLASSPLAAPNPIGSVKESKSNELEITLEEENSNQEKIWKSVTESKVVKDDESLQDDPVDEELLDLEEELPTQDIAIDNEPQRIHLVKSGDMLSTISRKYLGSSARYNEIFEANRDLLNSPHDLKVGMKLKIPNSKMNYSPIANRQNPTTRNKQQSVVSKSGRKVRAKTVATDRREKVQMPKRKSSISAPEPRNVTTNSEEKLIPMRRKRPDQKYKRSNTHLDELLSENPSSFTKRKSRKFKVAKKKEMVDQSKE